MKTPSSIHIIGKLAENPRGKRLQNYLTANLSAGLPVDTALCFASGQDYQTRTPAEQQEWLAWAAKPGNALILVPPFHSSVSHAPNGWEVASLNHPPELDQTAHMVLWHTQQEISASIVRGLVPTLNPIIEGGSRLQLSGVYRKHPDSGIFGLTVVPIWSLALADEIPLLVDWLFEWATLAGMPYDEPDMAKRSTFNPSPLHFSLMVYLASGKYSDRDAAINALKGNDTFDFGNHNVGTLLDEIVHGKYASGGSLTDFGRQALMESSFRAYAETYLKDTQEP